MKTLRSFIALSLFFVLVAAADEPVSRIGSIDGVKTVEINGAAGKRRGGSGETLRPGDVISTGSNVTMTVLSPEGSVLVVGQKSAIGIEKSKDKVQTVRINSGVLRGIVSKARKIPGSNDGNKKFRLIIRTRSAVLGVRGTDFVISAEAAKPEVSFHTLDGTVEIAKDEVALNAGEVTPVRGGEFVRATPSAIDAPQVFDRARFAQSLNEVQPGLNIPAEAPATSPEPSPEPSAEQPKEDRSSLDSFQFGVYGLKFKDESGEFGGVTASWNPTWKLLGDWLFVRGHLGALTVSGDRVNKEFQALDARALLSFEFFNHLILELGPSLQFWLGEGTGGGGGLLLGWRFDGRLFGFIDRIFVSSGETSLPRSITGSDGGSETRLGIGIRPKP